MTRDAFQIWCLSSNWIFFGKKSKGRMIHSGIWDGANKQHDHWKFSKLMVVVGIGWCVMVSLFCFLVAFMISVIIISIIINKPLKYCTLFMCLFHNTANFGGAICPSLEEIFFFFFFKFLVRGQTNIFHSG